MRKFLLLAAIFFNLCLNAGIPVKETYYGPTEQLIKRESWKKIEKELLSIKIPRKLFPYFNQIANEEDWGHIGYHGATQDFRVYQDIIRLTIEEIVGIPIRSDFQFLRVPGDKDLNLNTMDAFREHWGNKIDNKSDLRAKQLLSMNYAIYSNFDQKGSCSVALFVKDKSKSDINYSKQLRPFYQALGISTSALDQLFKIAHKHLDGDGGILLRLLENSHLSDSKGEAYNFADIQSYPCRRGGYPWSKSLISTEFDKIMSNAYVSRKASIAPQLRLLLNNQYTLNPFSHLSVERWDLYDAETIQLYEEELRSFIRDLEFDSAKVEKYRETLLQNWSED